MRQPGGAHGKTPQSVPIGHAFAELLGSCSWWGPYPATPRLHRELESRNEQQRGENDPNTEVTEGGFPHPNPCSSITEPGSEKRERVFKRADPVLPPAHLPPMPNTHTARHGHSKTRGGKGELCLEYIQD